MKALILAAGYATRLYPLTKRYPKPLLRVGERPIINYILDKLEKINDIDEVLVVTNSKFISRFRRWVKGLKAKKRVSLIDDLTKNYSHRRGAIGDIYFVIDKKRIKDNLLVIGGDNLFDGDLKAFLSFAKANSPHPIIGTYNIGNIQEAKKYGVVILGRSQQLVDFQEKPSSPKSTLVAMCLYYLPKESLGLIREYLNNKTHKRDATGFYIDWLRKKVLVYGFVFDGLWYDIGDHQFYHRVRERFK